MLFDKYNLKIHILNKCITIWWYYRNSFKSNKIISIDYLPLI